MAREERGSGGTPRWHAQGGGDGNDLNGHRGGRGVHGVPHHQDQLRPIPDRGGPSMPKRAKPNKQRSRHLMRLALCPGPALTTLEWQIPENIRRPALASANAVPREHWAHHWHISQRHGTFGWGTSPARPLTLPARHQPQCSRGLASPSPATTAPQPRSCIFLHKCDFASPSYKYTNRHDFHEHGTTSSTLL